MKKHKHVHVKGDFSGEWIIIFRLVWFKMTYKQPLAFCPECFWLHWVFCKHSWSWQLLAGKCMVFLEGDLAFWFRGCTDQATHSMNVLEFSWVQEYVYSNTNTRLEFGYGLAMSCCAYILRYVMAHSHSFPLSRFRFIFITPLHTLSSFFPWTYFQCSALLFSAHFFACVLSFPELGARWDNLRATCLA